MKTVYRTQTIVTTKVPVPHLYETISEQLENRLEQAPALLEVVTDITERKPAEKALQESEEKYRNLVERANDGICILQNETLAYCNPKMEELSGYSNNELIGTHFIDYVHRDSVKQISANYNRRIAGEKISTRYEATFNRKDGSILYAELNAGLIMYKGKPANMVIIRDITEHKCITEELKKSHDDMKVALEGTIQALGNTIEVRDSYTAEHQRAVTKLAVAIANEMGLSEEQIQGLRVAAMLHDIGKIAIPSEILSKPTTLSEIERGFLRKHPQTAYNILETVKFPWPVCHFVLQHHERLDGSGYPEGLRSDEIGMEARILAVADVVAAMTAHRPYRPAWSVDKAIEEIMQKRGIAYDAAVVDACIRVLSKESAPIVKLN